MNMQKKKKKLFVQIKRETIAHCESCTRNFFAEAGYDGIKTGECDCTACHVMDDMGTALLSLEPVGEVALFLRDLIKSRTA